MDKQNGEKSETQIKFNCYISYIYSYIESYIVIVLYF